MSSPPDLVDSGFTTDRSGIASEKWEDVANGIGRFEKQFTFEDREGRLTLFRFEAGQFNWSFEYATSAQSVFGWADSLPRADFVANGVYFHDDFSPSGLLIKDGERVGERAFDVDKSGVLVFGDDPRVIDTSVDKFDFVSANEAGQSFPFLIRGGQTAVVEDSFKYASRTFVGTDRDGVFYVGTYDGAVSLFELSNVLNDLPVSWGSILNLDGGPSSGYAFRDHGEISGANSLTAVPNVIAGFRK